MEQARQWIPYCGAAPGPQEWLGRWNLDPALAVVLLMLALALWLPSAPPDVHSRRRLRALRCSWALIALLYVSPLCALGSAFFTARVLHHMALVFLVAPLLAYGLGPSLQRLRMPVWTCALLAAVTLWIWHAPGPYEVALSSDAIFWLMQSTLLGSALAFWTAVGRAGPALAMAAILVSTVLMGLLGALITFAAQPLYAPHAASTLDWGISPLEDQQLAGILMWGPGSFAYLLAAMWIGWGWMRAERAGLPGVGTA